ncbi:MAG: hypothetical protein MJY57_04695 [Bacteroidales bacterium]|nr:hypothetical protein [Bacteroidales bacterium]
MKKTLILAAIAALCCSCSTPLQKSVTRSASFIDLNGTIASTVTLADLQISDKHVSGSWVISPAEKNNTISFDKNTAQKLAVANALDITDADILVAPKWTYTYENGKLVEVNVVGYPAKYANFRTKEEPKPEPCECKAASDPTIVIYNNKK